MGLKGSADSADSARGKAVCRASTMSVRTSSSARQPSTAHPVLAARARTAAAWSAQGRAHSSESAACFSRNFLAAPRPIPREGAAKVVGVPRIQPRSIVAIPTSDGSPSESSAGRHRRSARAGWVVGCRRGYACVQTSQTGPRTTARSRELARTASALRRRCGLHIPSPAASSAGATVTELRTPSGERRSGPTSAQLSCG